MNANVGTAPQHAGLETAFIRQLIESFGFTAIDLGGLAMGGRLQQAGGPLVGRDLVEFGHQ